MRMLSLVVMAAILLTGLASSQEKANPQEQAEASAKKIKEERIATLKEVVDQSLQLATGARIEIGDLLEARMSLLKAELDAAEKESDRITLYKNGLEALEAYEKLAQARVDAGRRNRTAVLKVKAKRLEVEILLEKAKMKEAKEGK